MALMEPMVMKSAVKPKMLDSICQWRPRSGKRTYLKPVKNMYSAIIAQKNILCSFFIIA
jgi:hypothetical protein